MDDRGRRWGHRARGSEGVKTQVKTFSGGEGLEAERPQEHTLEDKELKTAETDKEPAAPGLEGEQDFQGEEPGPEEPPEDVTTALKEELAARQEEIERLRSQLLRLRADFDNYRKRARREQLELKQTACAELVEELLPVLDNLERAMATARGGGEEGALLSGIELVFRQLVETLGRYGLSEVKALGQPFDPAYHEAVATEEATGPEGHNLVTEEFRKGYLLHGRLLRPALVKVALLPAPVTAERGKEARNEG
ncbi:MAG: Protein GrpE [Moorella sp. 60_41]|nr:MAG: Protein GrpE [Moorella sp. 60_41]